MSEQSAQGLPYLSTSTILSVASGIAALVLLYLMSTANYVLFHSIVEIITIVIGLSVFVLVWNSRKYIDNSYFFVIGIGFLFISAIDLVHTLAYKGMGVFPGATSDLPTQLWIAARYLQVATLLAAPLMIGKKVRLPALIAGYTGVTAILLGSIYSGIFPHCFIEGQGLTAFKIGSEYLISFFLVLATVALWYKRKHFNPEVFRLLVAANILTIGAELAFTSYISVYGFMNMTGHMFRLVATVCFYLAFLAIGHQKPFDLLLRDLKEQEDRYRFLAENTGDVIWLLDLATGRFLYVSPSVERLRGYTPEEVMSQTMQDTLTKGSYQFVSGELPGRIAAFESGDISERIRTHRVDQPCQDGSIVNTEVVTTLVPDTNGNVIRILGVSRDITKQVEAERENTRLASFPHLTPVMIVETDQKGKVLYSNPAMKAQLAVLGLSDPLVFVPASCLDQVKRDGEDGRNQWQKELVIKDRIFFENIFFVPELDSLRIYATDVTDQRVAEKQIFALKKQIEFVLGATKTGLDIIDKDYNLRYIDPEWAKIYGDPAGKKCYDYFMGRDSVCSGCGVRKAFETKQPVATEEVLTRENNRIVQVTSLPYQTETGEWLVAEVNVDITDRKRIEDALRLSENRFRLVLDTLPIGLWLADREGRLIYGNSAGQAIWAAHPHVGQEEYGIFKAWRLPGRESIQPDDWALAHAVNKGMTTTNELLEIEAFDGSHKFILNGAAPIRNEKAEIVGAFVINEDITERYRAQDALRDSEEKFRQLFTRMPSAVAIYEAVDGGEDFIFKDFNLAAEKIEGIKKDDLIGKRVTQVFPGVKDFGVFAVFQHVWRTGQPEFFPSAVYRDEHDPGTWRESWVYKVASGEVISIYHDITERKRAEEALRESKALVDAVVENVPLMIFLKEATDLRFVIFNRAGEELLGYDRKALLGKNNLDLFPPEQAAHFMTKDREVLEGEPGMLDIPEEPIMTAKKGLRLLHTRKVCIRGADGTTKFLLGISEDITEHKRAEDNLKFSNLILSTQQEVSLDGILIIDESGKIISFNRRFIEIWGIPPDVVASRSDERALQSVIDKLENPEEFLARVNYLYANRDEKSREEITLKDGRVLDRYSAPMSGSDGKYYGRVWNFRDITDRKRMEDALRESHQLFADIIGFLPDATLVVDQDGKVIAWNRAMERLTGIPAPDMIGKGDHDYSIWAYGTKRPILVDLILHPDEDFVRSHYTKFRQEGNTITADADLTRADGRIITLSLVASPLFNGKGESIGAIESMHDITRLREAENLLVLMNENLADRVRERTKDLVAEVVQRKKAEEVVQASLEEKIVLLREVHHRVKNNLQILISLFNLQSRTITDPQVISALKESTQRIRAMSMVHEKLYTGSDLAHIEFINYLSSLANSQVSFYQLSPGRIKLELNGENIMLDINTAIPLGLIMNELISNAFKHAFPGDRKGIIRINIRGTEERLEISIADDGIGVPEGFDVKTSPTLGLRLVNILIEQLSGTIMLDRAGTGTMYHIRIPKKER
jgi:PAS domain S-box-containing protein